MSQQELLKRVVQSLHDAGIDYMISGSVASSLQGEPRSSHDIDIVILIGKASAKKLTEAFPPPAFYLDGEAIIDAIDKKDGMFNLIDVDSGDKVDFWLLTDEPFDQSRFARRYEEEIAGIRVSISAPEDTILAKLRWAKLSGGSEKQFIDAMRVYEVQFKKLDINYLQGWAKRLGIESLLKRLQKEAEALL